MSQIVACWSENLKGKPDMQILELIVKPKLNDYGDLFLISVVRDSQFRITG